MDRPTKSYDEVKAMLGASSDAWERLLGYVRFHYIMDESWQEGKPTHKNYNNLFIRRSGKSLIMFSLREGYFMTCVVLGKNEREKFEEQRGVFGEAIGKVYDDAETLHDGKWLAFDIYDDSLVDDIIRLLHIKRKPNRKILPENLENCGRLDLGLSHEDITNRIIT